jgi:hypothetical protein
MFREIVAVYCENRKEHTDTVHTSQETHYISDRTSQETHYLPATETNRLMLSGETVAVYFKIHTEHTDIFRTSQETHYFSARKTNRLMLMWETVAAYFENGIEIHKYSLWYSHWALKS